jgi:Na+-translocating ferredoxin:NAD+ oxidoreductase RnfE subunit
MKFKMGMHHETLKIFLNGVFYKNPVLVGALGLYPVVAAGYNMRNAVELSLLFLFLAVPTCLLSCFIGWLVPAHFRTSVALLISAVFYLPAAWLTDLLIPGAISALGMFGALMICNSVIIFRASDYAPAHIAWAVLADTLGSSVGFALVICLSAAIREFWLKGSLWHTNTGIYGTSDKGVSLPFFGFILLGFFAAFVRWVNRKREEKKERRLAHK